MNKYLMLSAAAALSSVTAAHAGTYCFEFGSSGGSPCDSGRMVTGVDGGKYSGAVRAWQHLNYDCAGRISDGYGVLGKTPGLGDVSFMSDLLFFQNYGDSTAISWTFPKKIKNGKPWTLWIGFSGTTVFEGNSGTLSNVSNCQNGAARHGRKSTLSTVKEVIRAHRTAKAAAGGGSHL